MQIDVWIFTTGYALGSKANAYDLDSLYDKYKMNRNNLCSIKYCKNAAWSVFASDLGDDIMSISD